VETEDIVMKSASADFIKRRRSAMIPTIEWRGKHVRMIDQRKLPCRIEWYTCRTYMDVVKAIESMVIRGAPAIGVAAAMGLALGAGSIKTKAGFRKRFDEMSGRMLKARPTAVNLRWAVEEWASSRKAWPGCPWKRFKKRSGRSRRGFLKRTLKSTGR
jgi:methylthioribose-1-phosphate isomerase